MDSLNITDTILTMEVSKDCDKTINNNILKDKIDDILVNKVEVNWLTLTEKNRKKFLV